MMRGYIFDMDGVLCDSEELMAAAAIRMFKERYGIVLTKKDFDPFVGAGENRYLGGVAEKYGIPLQLPEDKDETYRLYCDCVVGLLDPLPGVLEFIKQASERGILLAVATSADDIKMEANLHEIGLDRALFSALVTGSQIEHKKPAPDIFLEAARRLELPPEDCIVFEDAINGVQAAKAAGCSCTGIASSFSKEALLEAGADRAIGGFLELK